MHQKWYNPCFKSLPPCEGPQERKSGRKVLSCGLGSKQGCL